MKRWGATLLFLAFFLGGSHWLHSEEAPSTDSFIINYESGERRDPFIPLIDSEGKVRFSFNTSDIVIEGIVYDPPKGSMVLIKDEFYKVGEVYGESKIIAIHKDKVILEQENEQKELRIREEIVDKDIS